MFYSFSLQFTALQVPQTVSVEATDLINRCLRVNPNERIRLEDVLSHSFMQKAQKGTFSKYNNTLASSDSGMLTMSSSKLLFNQD